MDRTVVRRRRSDATRMGVSVLAGLLLVSQVGCSKEAPKIPSTADVTLTSPSATGPVLPPGMVPGIVPPSATDASALWRQSAAGAFTAIGTAASAVRTAVQNVDVPAAQRACANLDAGRLALLQQLPAPEPALTAEVRGAVDDLGGAVALCQSFSPSSPDIDFEQYSRLVSDAMAKLDTAVNPTSP